jgi:hypothetical protein
MILTPDFVYIHHPKTGGTFVTDMLSRLYGDRQMNVAKHATCNDIPEEHRGKPIISAIRNPYDRYVSQYRFAWWKLHPDQYCGEEAMRALYPHYPDISFAEFIHLANTLFVNCHLGQPTGFVNRNFPPDRGLGWQTEQFVRFYFRGPRAVFARLDETSFDSGSFRKDMYDVRFLPVERLNQSLYELLLGFGHSPEEIAFVRSAQKVFPVEGGRDLEDRWQDYYTPEIRDTVRTRERLLFELFPQFDTAWEEAHA